MICVTIRLASTFFNFKILYCITVVRLFVLIQSMNWAFHCYTVADL